MPSKYKVEGDNKTMIRKVVAQLNLKDALSSDKAWPVG
jgi:hypothetical protein